MIVRPIALGIIRKGDKILLQKVNHISKKQVFYRPIGGGIEFGEHSKDTVIRELREEFGIEGEGCQLLAVIENIFEHKGKKGHEIVFLYEVTIQNGFIIKNTPIERIDKKGDNAEWVGLHEIRQRTINFFPVELIYYL